MTLAVQEKSHIAPFLFALKTPETKRQYTRNLKLFFDFGLGENLSLSDQATIFAEKALNDTYWATNYFMQFFKYQIEKRLNGVDKIGSGTVRNYYKASKLFCIMNDINLNWVKIAKGLPRVRYYSDDRAPTIEEVRRLIAYPDRRMKPIIYTMISSGIRIGAWEYLKWKHVIPIPNRGDVIAAKLLIYAGDVEEYYSFITLEAYDSLKEWIDYRKRYGERISGDSWLMRDSWQTSERSYGARVYGVAENPRKLNLTGIKSLIERAIHAQGLWEPLTDGKKRREWKGAHGFRKYFKTQCEQVMKTINVEFCMGHKSDKLQKAYYKPKETDVLGDYLKAADLLTVNEEFRLREKVKKLTEKGKDSEYIIKGRLEELTKKYDKVEQFVQSMIDSGQLKAKPDSPPLK